MLGLSLCRLNLHALFLATTISQSRGEITTPTFTTTMMWGYKDFTVWPNTSASSQCAEGLQSPIDIKPTKITKSLDTDSLDVFGRSLTGLVLNTGPECKSAMFETTPHKWKVGFLSEELCLDRMWIDWHGITYFLQFIDFRSPSETTIDGKTYDMEAHVHHVDMETGKTLIIAVLMKVGQKNRYFQHVMMSFPSTISEVEAKADIALNPYKGFFPDDWSYWAFNGSLTTPPCTTDVQWIVMKTPVEISAAQRNAYRAAMTAVPGNSLGMKPEVPKGVTEPWSIAQGINTRPVQPQGDRIIYEYPVPDQKIKFDASSYVPSQVHIEDTQLNEVSVEYARSHGKGFLASLPLSALVCAVFVSTAILGYFAGCPFSRAVGQLWQPSSFTRPTASDRNLLMAITHPENPNEEAA